QRAEPAARSLGFRESHDDEVVDPISADFQPVTGAAAAVGAVGLLGHDALEAELHDLLVQSLAVLLEMLGVAQWTCLRQHLMQNFLALDERKLAEIVAAEGQEIEDVERRRRFDCRALRLTGPELR